MKMVNFLSAILLFTMLSPAFGQIAIESGDIPSEPGTSTLLYGYWSVEGTDVDIGQAGENQYWDFTDLIFPRIDEDQLIVPADANLIDEFPSASRVLRAADSGFNLDIDDGYRYELIDGNGWNLLGIELDPNQGLGLPVEFLNFDDPLTILPMPAEYGDAWDMGTTVVITMAAPDSLADNLDSLELTFVFEGSAEIDAWGTLNHPTGTVDVLRKHLTGTGVVTGIGIIYIFNQRAEFDLGEVYTFPVTHSYRWYTPDFDEIASITSRAGFDEPNFNLASKIRIKFLDDTQHYNVASRTQSLHKVAITDVFLAANPISAGWEIGVFTPDGVLAGSGVWRNNGKIGFPAYADDPDTEEIEGFIDGEQMSFSIWDNDSGQEYEASAVIEEGEDVWSENGRSVFTLEAGAGIRELIASMNAGWNLISLNVRPGQEFYAGNENRGPGVILMTDQLRVNENLHHIIIMKNEDGRFYAPSVPFNNIPYWDLLEGMQVKVDAAVNATWSGDPIRYNEDIPVATGWNFIPYFPSYPLSCSTPAFYAISPIAAQVTIIKDATGRFASPAFNFSNLRPLSEGKGYKIKTTADVVLNYPGPELEQGFGPMDFNLLPNEMEIYTQSSENMSVLVNSRSGFELAESVYLAAYNSDDKIVGLGNFNSCGQCGLAVWGDDLSTEVVEGLSDNEAFELRLCDENQTALPNLRISVSKGNSLVYKTDGFLVLSVDLTSDIPDNYYLSSAYPNPFNSSTKINYGLPNSGQVSLNVVNLLGQQITTLFEGNQQAGIHTATFTANNMPSGLYFIRLEASDQVISQKVMLIR